MSVHHGPAPAGLDTAAKPGAVPASGPAPVSRRRRGLSRGLAVLGLASLCYLLGAAVMAFDLPSSGFLGKAFLGARSWYERRQATARPIDPAPAPVSRGRVDKPGATFDGFTLCSFASMTARSSQAFLLDMRGNVVHRWAIDFSKVWPNPVHLSDPVHDSLVCFFGCRLYPNGDLLVVFHGLENVAKGYGLARLDRDSHVVWRYSAKVHHDVDVAEDGTIYAIQYEVAERPPPGLDFLPTPCLVDYLVHLSPEGKPLGKPISLVAALRDSGYAPLLAGRAAPERPRLSGLPVEILHTNFVQVLTPELAPRFPAFRAGQVLLSMREVDALAVLDPATGSVVWATNGPWRGQHDAQFLANGHLLIFDNLGSPLGSRVLEYDPKTHAFPWSYAGADGSRFRSNERGMCQRLPNGNTLVVNSEGRELREVTAAGEVVWSRTFDAFICSARRYSPDQLPFLKGGPRARP
jgi:hypothetical protein